MPAPSSPRYAVLFRTHIWDAFVAGQYERLKQLIGRGDLYVLLDETNGSVATGQPAVVNHTNASIEALGLAPAGGGNMLWYNGDYPLYFFYAQHPDYDFYVMTEYDVCVNVDLDTVIDRAARAGADLVSLGKGEPVADWAHAESCHAVYPPEAVEKRLICFAAFSRDRGAPAVRQAPDLLGRDPGGSDPVLAVLRRLYPDRARRRRLPADGAVGPRHHRPVRLVASGSGGQPAGARAADLHPSGPRPGALRGFDSADLPGAGAVRLAQRFAAAPEPSAGPGLRPPLARVLWTCLGRAVHRRRASAA